MLGRKLSVKGKDLLACPLLPPDLVALDESEASGGSERSPAGPTGCSPGLVKGWAIGPGAGPPSARRLLLGPADPQGARVTPFLRLLPRE